MSATLEIVRQQMKALEAEVARLREELERMRQSRDRSEQGKLDERAAHEATDKVVEQLRAMLGKVAIIVHLHESSPEWQSAALCMREIRCLIDFDTLRFARDQLCLLGQRAVELSNDVNRERAMRVAEAWETEAGHAADLNDSRRSNTLRDCAAQLRAITTTATPTGQLGKMLCIACEVYFVSFAAMVEHCRQRHPEELEPATPPSLCEHCGKPATCCGSYEGSSAGFACDDCCGHGCEDGKCEPVTATPAATGADIVRTQDSNAYELDLPRAAKEAKGG